MQHYLTLLAYVLLMVFCLKQIRIYGAIEFGDVLHVDCFSVYSSCRPQLSMFDHLFYYWGGMMFLSETMSALFIYFIVWTPNIVKIFFPVLFCF